jgi:1-deoxy-D-xylulose-5-phosphate synthase
MVAEGGDILIVAVGSMVPRSLEASRILSEEGIEAGVLDPRFVKPLDRDLIIEKAVATKNIVVVEEGILAGGFGGAVLELFSEEGITDVNVGRLGIADLFVEHGTRDELLTELGLTGEGIARYCRDMLQKGTGPKLRTISSNR